MVAKPVRLGFIGVGIRGTLLMEAAKGISGVDIVAAADCYKGHLDRASELISPSIETTGDYTAAPRAAGHRRRRRSPRPTTGT